jgi:oligoribonuclease NrnB/cAMP/cGMP phosphodiesterase (DHH superfamily)
MTKLCIYHGNCPDGFGAAYAVWKRFGSEVEYHPATHGAPPPDVTGKDVIMVDFSYNRPVLTTMLEKCNSMIILDHHKTAQSDLEGLVDPKLTLVFDMTRSGAIITWQYFHPYVEIPKLLLHVQDRDIWTWKLENSRQILTALDTYDMRFEVWDGLSVDKLTSAGEHMVTYYSSIIGDMVDKAEIMQLDGHKVPVINAPHFMSSDLGNILAKDYPFAVVYSVDSRGVRYSLRSVAGGLDVSEIAKSHGGGGHFHAAGFETKTPIHKAL